MKYLIYLITCFILALVLWSCEETTETSYNAEKLTIEQVGVSTGYDWFNPMKDSYNPDSSTIAEIKATFNPSLHKVLFFVTFACGCVTPLNIFPESIKSLQEAKIPDSLIEIYSMRTIKDSHPYSGKIQLEKLPTIIIMKNSEPKYNVVKKYDEIRARNPDSTIKIEQLILEGLKQ